MARKFKYPEEFRREAVELVKTSGRTQADIARSLGVNITTLSAWLIADRDKAAQAADPKALSEDERDELRRLRREVQELRQDREILRKAAAYFARETMR